MSPRSKEAHINAVGGVPIMRASEAMWTLERSSGETGLAWLIQGAIERGGVRDEEAQVARGKASGKLDGDADVVFGPVPKGGGSLRFSTVSPAWAMSAEAMRAPIESDRRPDVEQL